MKTSVDYTTFTFEITKKLKRKIKNYANDRNESLKEFMTRIIEKYFKSNEAK